jgi:hypothetical protein
MKYVYILISENGLQPPHGHHTRPQNTACETSKKRRGGVFQGPCGVSNKMP